MHKKNTTYSIWNSPMACLQEKADSSPGLPFCAFRLFLSVKSHL
jgi:hypothetical protein